MWSSDLLVVPYNDGSQLSPGKLKHAQTVSCRGTNHRPHTLQIAHCFNLQYTDFRKAWCHMILMLPAPSHALVVPVACLILLTSSLLCDCVSHHETSTKAICQKKHLSWYQEWKQPEWQRTSPQKKYHSPALFHSSTCDVRKIFVDKVHCRALMLNPVVGITGKRKDLNWAGVMANGTLAG